MVANTTTNNVVVVVAHLFFRAVVILVPVLVLLLAGLQLLLAIGLSHYCLNCHKLNAYRRESSMCVYVYVRFAL